MIFAAHLIIVLFLVGGIIFLLAKNKENFFSSCWLYLSFFLFILYHIVYLIGHEKFAYFYCLLGVLYLNKYFIEVISIGSKRVFDKINFFVSQILIYILSLIFIYDLSGGNKEVLEWMIKIILGIIVFFNIFYLVFISKIKQYLFLKWPIRLLTFACIFSMFGIAGDPIWWNIFNSALSISLYGFTIWSYNYIENNKNFNRWE